MAFIRKRGKTKFMYFNWDASSGAIAAGSLMMIGGDTGYTKIATSTTPAEEIMGVLRHAIATTDANYAVDHPVEIEVPVELNVVWEADVTASLATTNVGKVCDLTDAATVNAAASTYDIALCTGYISTTKGEFILNVGALASTT